MKNIVFLFLFTTVLTAQNFKNDLEILKSKNQKCLDGGKFMYECSVKYNVKIDSLLNVVYKNVKSKLKVEDQNKLIVSQLDWLKTRDLKFKQIDSEATGLGEGEDDLLVKQLSKVDVVVERVNYLIDTDFSAKKLEYKDQVLEFVPPNYEILESFKGNLDSDKFEDLIVVLKKKNEEKTSDFNNNKPEKRPLLLFMGTANNKIELKIKTDNAVLCVDGSGAVHGDSFEGITIKNGFFSIEYFTVGGVDKWTKVTTFRYDFIKKNWFLHKDGMEFFKFNTSKKPNAEPVIKTGQKVLTTKDFGVVSLKDYSVYKK